MCLFLDKAATDDIFTQLVSGKVVMLPTDTIYGLCVDASDSLAVQRLYGLKRRSLNKPMPILCSNIEMVLRYCSLDAAERAYVELCWPGPTTMLLKKLPTDHENGLAQHLEGLSTLGIRVPDSDFLQRLISKLNRPIIATSANFSGIPYAYENISSLYEYVDCCVADETSSYKGGIPSSVVKIEGGKVVKLR